MGGSPPTASGPGAWSHPKKRIAESAENRMAWAAALGQRLARK